MAGHRLRDIDHYERILRSQGFARIAGVDEAGRGALAGPLVAAAVVLPPGFEVEGLEDSKVLTRARREELYARVIEAGASVSISRASPGRIDRQGLHRTNLALLRHALRSLPEDPDFVLADGFPLGRLPSPSLGVRKGDAVTATVAAASIVAKVTRDRIMDRYHRRFPAYGFETNRGYGTRDHWDALVAHGPCAIHRLSFNGVASPRGAHNGDPAEEAP